MERFINKTTLGDSYEMLDCLPENCIDCVYIDIPYLYTKGGIGHSEISKRVEKKKDELKEISSGIDYSIFNKINRVAKKTNMFVWCSKMQLLDIMNIYKDKTIDVLVWCKTNPTPTGNNSYLPDLEYCLHIREKGVLLNGGYELKSKFYISPANKHDKDLFLHPTIKPLALVKRHILHATKPKDVVLDCFMGSGTTAVACKETLRNFIGFEINEEYVKIANDRINGIDANGVISFFVR